MFAQPDGSWKAESTSGPAQVRDGDPGEDGTGGWNRIDATLEKSGKGLSPKHSAVEVTFSGGDTDWFAKVTREGHTLDYSFDGPLAGRLPTPVVEGDTAVYRDVFAGVVEDVDLVMQSSGTGFSHWLVLTKAPSAEELKALGAARGRDEVSFPVRVEDSNTKSPALVEVGTAGNISITDAAGKKLITASAPLAWDAQTMGPEDFDPAAVALATRGDSSLAKSRKPEGTQGAERSKPKVVAIDTDVEQPKDKAKRAKKGSQVSLGVEKSFLTDSTTAYPVTIDPSMTVYTGDTWVQTPTYPTSQSSSAELKVGTYNGGTDKARSFMNFGTTAWNGKYIESATLVMRNFYSGSCTSGAIRVNRLAQDWDAATLTWANQPSAVVEDSVDNGTAKGYSSSCAEGDVKWNVTPLVRKWVHENKSRFGLRMKAVDETSNNTWRRYRSGNYSANSNQRPHIVVSYSHYPNTAGTPSVTGISSSGAVTNPKLKISATVSDPDGGNVKANFEVLRGSTVVWSGSSANVASGKAASVETTALADGTYTIRAKGNDGVRVSKNWSASRTVTIDTTAPTVSIIASAYGTNAWLYTKPASSAFTFRSPDTDISHFWVWKDGVDWQSMPANVNREATLWWNPGAGGHRVSVIPIDKNGHQGAAKYFYFGHGAPSITTPVVGKTPQVSGSTKIQASGEWKSGTTASLKWRRPGATTWSTVATPMNVSQSGAAAIATSILDTSTLGADDAEKRTAMIVEFQVCFTYPSVTGETCSTETNAAQIKRIPSAFGDGFPTTDVEGGQVALRTGELAASATDASLDAGDTTLSISRDHTSFGTPHPSAAGNVFGPGWVTELSSSEAGVDYLQLLDSTRYDGTIKLTDNQGTVLTFAPTSAFGNAGLTRRTAQSIAGGQWWPWDEESDQSGLTAHASTANGKTTVKFTDAEGVETTFESQGTLAANANAVFVAKSVKEPGAPGVTTYEYANDRVTKIIANGRSLNLTYTNSTSNGRLQKVEAFRGTASLGVQATYTYNAAGLLTSVTDAAGLTTSYSYTGGDWPRLASMTPPGQTPIEYVYSNDAAGNRLIAVNRARVDSDISKSSDPTARLTTLVYGLPAQGQAALDRGLPSIDADLTNTWLAHTESMPEAADATAVFGADIRPSSEPSAEDFKYADIIYTDAAGYEVYGAEFGAGAWRYTATQYEPDSSRVIRELSTNDTLNIANGEATPYSAGTLTVYNKALYNGSAEAPTPLKDGDPTGLTLAGGSLVTDVYEPARKVQTADGAIVARVHTRTIFDEGAPALQPADYPANINPKTQQRWAVPTRTVTSLASSDAEGVAPGSTGSPDAGLQTGEEIISHQIQGYDVPGTLTNVTGTQHTGFTTAVQAMAGDAGKQLRWSMGLATTSTTVMGSTPDASKDITTRTAYDSQGRVIATVQPNAVAANPNTFVPAHAGTRLTSYYTASGSGDCLNANYAGWLCKTTYAGTADGGANLITEKTTAYNNFGQATTVVETGHNSATRTTTNTYDVAGRMTSTQVTGTLGHAVPKTTHAYHPTLGFETTVSPAAGAAITRTYDSWGRETSYTTGASTSQTQYDKAGRVHQIRDDTEAGDGTLTYTYNTTTGSAQDYRGLPTKITATNPGQSPVEITGIYDAQGRLVTQASPGGVVQHTEYDMAGDVKAMTYDIGDAEGVLAWSQTHDALGRVVTSTTPNGDVMESAPTLDSATIEYSYDRASRLTKVTDTTSVQGGTPACLTREYAFDKNGNRTSKTTESCTTTPANNTLTWTYDNADRFKTPSGYVYDGFGRVTTMPGNDTPKAELGGSNIAIEYYVDDAVRTLDGTVYTRDAAGRVTTDGALTRYYTDSSDNASWTKKASDVEWSLPGLNGDLAASKNVAGAGVGSLEVPIVNPHGDILTQVIVPATGSPAGVSTWSPTDEYGNQLQLWYLAFSVLPTQVAGSTWEGGIGYGWLGAKEREVHGSGLTLMGARVYNPYNGSFTSVDPIFSGNSTAYTYPQDPVNSSDLTGEAAPVYAIVGGVKVCIRFCNKLLKVFKITKKSPKAPKRKSSRCPNSFDGDTEVLMADGSLRLIEEVRTHDYVWAHDPETGAAGPRPVVDVIRGTGIKAMVTVEVAGGTKIDATSNHPFWSDAGSSLDGAGSWVNAGDLTVGDRVLNSLSQPLMVTGLTYWKRPIQVFNLSISGINTFHVGPDSIVVHNQGCNNQIYDKKQAKRLLSDFDTDPHSFKEGFLPKNTPVSRYDVAVCKKCKGINIVRKKGQRGKDVKTGFFAK